MTTEIERKFLVRRDRWQPDSTGKLCRQGYLPTTADCTVRIRVIGTQAFLTIKGVTQGVSRQEYEYPIPVNDASKILQELCLKPLIEKTRHEAVHNGVLWEIDVFHGANDGLIVAEVELESENQMIDCPEWVGQEVSDNPRYYNVNLVKVPYREWKRNEDR